MSQEQNFQIQMTEELFNSTDIIKLFKVKDGSRVGWRMVTKKWWEFWK